MFKSQIRGFRSKPSSPRRRRCLPVLEICEGRTLLSTLDVTNSSHANIKGSLLYENSLAQSGDTLAIEASVGASIVLVTEFTLNGVNIDATADPSVTIYDGHPPAAAETIQMAGSVTLTYVAVQLGVKMAANSTLVATGCTFSNSSTSGAINASAGGDSVTVNGSTFTTTSAGLGNDEDIVGIDATVSLTSDTFASDNTNSVSVTRGTLTATGCNWSGSQSGYAVVGNGTAGTISGSTFSANPGGDISWTGGTLLVQTSKLSGNSTSAAGVTEVALNGGSDTFNGDVLNGNTQLGSVISDALNGGALTLQGVGIVGNVSGPSVLGTVSVTGPSGTLTVTGSVLANNTAHNGPALYVGAGVTANIGTVAIVGNINAGGDGVGGIEAASGGSAVLGNSVVYGNSQTDVGAGVTGAYNNVGTGNLSGLTHTVTGNPNGTLDTTLDTYTLGTNSPDIGAGANGGNIGPDQTTSGGGGGSGGSGGGSGGSGGGSGGSGGGSGGSGGGSGGSGGGSGGSGGGSGGSGGGSGGSGGGSGGSGGGSGGSGGGSGGSGGGSGGSDGGSGSSGGTGGNSGGTGGATGGSGGTTGGSGGSSGGTGTTTVTPPAPVLIVIDLRPYLIQSVNVKGGRPTQLRVAAAKKLKHPPRSVAIVEQIGARPVVELNPRGKLLRPALSPATTVVFYAYNTKLGGVLNKLARFGSVIAVTPV